jgi:hypothetical protein
MAFTNDWRRPKRLLVLRPVNSTPARKFLKALAGRLLAGLRAMLRRRLRHDIDGALEALPSVVMQLFFRRDGFSYGL